MNLNQEGYPEPYSGQISANSAVSGTKTDLLARAKEGAWPGWVSPMARGVRPLPHPRGDVDREVPWGFPPQRTKAP